MVPDCNNFRPGKQPVPCKRLVPASTQSPNLEYKDTVEKVIQKLAVLDNLFEFYQYTKDMANFSYDAIPGLCYIINDCINELKSIH